MYPNFCLHKHFYNQKDQISTLTNRSNKIYKSNKLSKFNKSTKSSKFPRYLYNFTYKK